MEEKENVKGFKKVVLFLFLFLIICLFIAHFQKIFNTRFISMGSVEEIARIEINYIDSSSEKSITHMFVVDNKEDIKKMYECMSNFKGKNVYWGFDEKNYTQIRIIDEKERIMFYAITGDYVYITEGGDNWGTFKLIPGSSESWYTLLDEMLDKYDQ